jgi:hypothetical protein
MVVLFLMGLLIYCIVDSIIWLFIGGGGDFLFSFEYVKKIFKASVMTGLIIGIGDWWMRYKPFKSRR